MWLARRAALESLYGDWLGSYEVVPQFLFAIKTYIPSSVIDLECVDAYTDPSQTIMVKQFQRCFWSFCPCIVAFKRLKPMLQIDGTHLYGKFKGKLLIAAGQDGNRKIVSLAFAIVESESGHAWEFFLDRVRKHLVRDRKNIAVISYRAQAIISIMKDDPEWQAPTAYHYLCIRHIASNFHKRFKNKRWKKYLTNTVYKIDTMIAAYMKQSFTSLGNEGYWPVYTGSKVVPHPNSFRIEKGQPKNSRIHNEMDEADERGTRCCRKCRQPGHTKSNCPHIGYG